MSNIFPMVPVASVDDVAAAWIAKIDAGPLSVKDRRALQLWLSSDPENEKRLDDFARIWMKAGSPRAKADLHVPARSRRRVIGAIAASVLAAVGLGLGTITSSDYERYTTAIGETSTVTLADGSRVILNTDTRLTVRFRDDRRDLRLERGEALFEVAHDVSRPFEVFAAGTITRAVGTRFSLRAVSSKVVKVVVTEGSVTLRDDEAWIERLGTGSPGATPVAAGQAASSKASAISVQRLKGPEVERATAWTTGGIAFRDERLADVLDEVNRYSRHPVRVAHPRLGELRVSGYLATVNVEGFLSGLAAGAGLTLDETANGALLLSDG